MGMYDIFATDEQSEIEGVVIDYGTFRVTLARAGGANKAFAKELERETSLRQKSIQSKTLTNEVADGILKRVYAKTVVRNWEVRDDGAWQQGIEARDGSVVPFTVANVLTVFDDLDDLYMDIRDSAQNLALYRRALREEAAGN